MHRFIVWDLIYLDFLLVARERPIRLILAIRVSYRVLCGDMLFLHLGGQPQGIVLQLFRHGGRLIVHRVHYGDPNRIAVLGRRTLRLFQVAYFRLASFPVWLPKCILRVRGHFKRCPDAA